MFTPQRLLASAAALALSVAACAGPQAAGPELPTATVTAAQESEVVGTANADAADDPAIWRNAADPAASLIVATDKRAGLHVYDLAGRRRDFIEAGRVNNVDLVETTVSGRPAVLVAATDRNDPAAARIALFRLDPATARLASLGTVPAGAGEAYGICLNRRGDAVDAFVVLKDGTINQVALDLAGTTPDGRILRTMKLASQAEGCVVDPRSQRLYVAEEDVGIWHFDANPQAQTVPQPVARVDGRTLIADVEGLALAVEPTGATLLVASSQGDNAFAVYDLADDRFVGRFRIAAGRFGAVSETDGIAVALGNFGPSFPEGLMVAQDGDNSPHAQNFKLVDWRSVRRALER